MKKVLAALALIGLCVAPDVYAANNVQNMGGYYINAQTGQLTDASGNALTKEQSPIYEQNGLFQGIINNSALANAAADSSAIIDVHRFDLGTLLFKITPSTGAGTKTRLAVSIREHLNGIADSVSTFPLMLYGQTPVVATSMVDTTLAGHLLTGSSTTPWSGEFIIEADAGRNSPVNAVAAVAFSYPNGIAIPLPSLFGRDVFLDYMSIRVRNITGPTAAVTVSYIAKAR